MQSPKTLQISLSKEHICVSDSSKPNSIELKLNWENAEHFPSLFEKTFQTNWTDLQTINVQVNNNLFLLVPDAYHSDLFISSFLEKAIGKKNSENCEIHHQTIEKEEATLSFYVPSLWKDYLALRLPLSNFQYTHFIGDQINTISKFIRNQFHVWLQDDFAYVVLRKNGQLQVANAFAYKDAIELAFYIHSLREAFQFVFAKDTFHLIDLTNNQSLLDQLSTYHIPIHYSYEQS